MARVLVVGAGVTGYVAAYTLAEHGVEVTIVEKADTFGGKVLSYGCKAEEECQNCGLCLTTRLWSNVYEQKNIHTAFNSTVSDVSKKSGKFSIKLDEGSDALNYKKFDFNNFDAIIVCTGFEPLLHSLFAHLHIDCTEGLITGNQIENLMLNRTPDKIFENPPKSIAFIQCVGSRDQNESGNYCSKVCCAYSTRSARVIHSYYPECEIVFFYMELQNVKGGDYYKELRELGIKFINCRPLKVTGGSPVIIEYDNQAEGILRKEFDLAVLADGICAGSENSRIAGIFKLDMDKNGFLQAVGDDSGIYVAGCARAPMKIEEAYADAVTVAGKVLCQINKQ
ncbi:MAG: FAD-dependent oxidoreductase [Oscillospiraceae bacterium]|nr:FAD-dependent oxidoreductase [Oscillospiraceae bacterium]